MRPSIACIYHAAGASLRWTERLPLAFLIALSLGFAGCGLSEPAENAEPPLQTEVAATSESDASVEPPESGSSDAPDNEDAGVTRVDKAKAETLLDETGGKVLVVNLWATWCLPCIAEMPHLTAFYNGMNSESTAFLSLSADGPRFIDDAVVPFVKEHNLPFPVYALDFEDPDPLILAGMLGVEETGWDGALPATFLFNRERKLVKHWFEEIKPGELEAAVAEVLAAG
ncbi:MAG: TlpA family protein disulfide reductase [Candidatus Hydrogenedentes bacterium]|nr:TlpA family protein disulfide reductase [Candidatus Hydrogenedentota bacterium]